MAESIDEQNFQLCYQSPHVNCCCCCCCCSFLLLQFLLLFLFCPRPASNSATLYQKKKILYFSGVTEGEKNIIGLAGPLIVNLVAIVWPKVACAVSYSATVINKDHPCGPNDLKTSTVQEQCQFFPGTGGETLPVKTEKMGSLVGWHRRGKTVFLGLCFLIFLMCFALQVRIYCSTQDNLQ